MSWLLILGVGLIILAILLWKTEPKKDRFEKDWEALVNGTLRE